MASLRPQHQDHGVGRVAGQVCDDAVVHLHALANAKLHYRHPDAATYGNQLESILVGLKNISWPKMTFNRKPDYDAEPRPRVV